MNRRSKTQSNVMLFGVPLVIMGLLVALTQLAVFKSHPEILSTGITFDLLLTVPLVYFLLIRKTKIPKTTVVLFFVIGLIVCSFIIPQEHQHYLNLAKTWVLPLVEISVVSFIVYKVRKAILQFKAQRDTSQDVFSALKITCQELLPKPLVIPFVTEISVFYYGFVNWKKKQLSRNEFSYHKNSGSQTLLFAFIFIIIIETIVLHLLLMNWNNTVAWVLTGLSIYTGIQLFGFAKSLSQRPIVITEHNLYLRYGIMNESIIDLKAIEAVELSSKSLKPDSESRHLSLLGNVEGHNVVLHVNQKQNLIGLYGFKKPFKSIAFHLDNPQLFNTYLNEIKNAYSKN